MKNEELLKAKVDFFKTMMGVSLGMSITTIVAFWSNINVANIPLKAFVEVAFWSFLAAVTFFFGYLYHYVKLINMLEDEKGK